MELYFPTEFGERVAFVCAAVTAALGLLVFLFPAFVLRLTAFQIGEVRPEGYAAVRSTGAHHLGFGVAAIMLAQDWIYMTLGIALGFAAVGRLLSCALDRGFTLRNAAFSLLQVVLAGGPLAYVFGYI
ncbi:MULTISPECIES: DUF4345 domain-containing protein [unclassified Neorhizobium]|uniref:AGROH133_08824 family phage infection protein n=1 Tax=unclassified Neorhizobium TaxID=2629175 RepID=UPI001FF6E6AA|nr:MULTISPECIES: DUF4345 domain-containing protein [unclassified Neorhizobium]MCJ9672021.1 DUF4345 domain-containing protein [Neorhizobium sp. SHOUNA12B]MCJ9747461.1 DUF4345 domain-containing protein [Neorhizobium sp. SHOUNA12A]